MKKEMVIAVIVIAFALYFILGGGKAPEIETGSEIETPSQITGAEGKNYVVEITSTGYAPRILNISKGDSVTWINVNSGQHWPASAMHPTHKVYPGSGIEKCGSSEQESIFDACRGLKPGENWSFTFDTLGSWGYHDHFNLANNGKINVG